MGLLDSLYRYGEPALGMLSGAAAEPIAGWMGLLGGGGSGVESARDAMTYQPRTPQGRQGQIDLMNALMRAKQAMVDNNPPVNAAVNGYNRVADMAGSYSPALGAAVRTLPAAAGLLVGSGPLKMLAGEGFAGVKPSTFSSKNVKIYDPKPLPQRPFHDDYSKGVAGQDGSAIKLDIDGNPLTAGYIAGRRTTGGEDVGFGRSEQDGIAGALGIKSLDAPRSGSQLNGDAGRYVSGNGQRSIYLDQAMPEDTGKRVFSHELGHAIDDIAFTIPTNGIKKELSTIYENLNTGGWYKPGRGMTPEGQGYKNADIGREHVAEAIRAYMTDPNYIKTVAPNTAARIREYVNQNPRLKDTIQFNGLAGGLLGEEYYRKND